MGSNNSATNRHQRKTTYVDTLPTEAPFCSPCEPGYCALIACLLIPIYTGRTPTKRTFELIYSYLIGWASLEEMERHIEKLPRPE